MDLHQRGKLLGEWFQPVGRVYVDQNAAIVEVEPAPPYNDTVAVQPGEAGFVVGDEGGH